MSYSAFDPGGCCCPDSEVCPVIGFTSSAWSPISACCTSSAGFIQNIHLDVSRLAECRIVFSGNLNECSTAVRFAVGDWPAVRTYIEGGGRLWINAEHDGSGCLTDPLDLLAFLFALGSSIQYIGGSYDTGCSSGSSRNCIPGVANIAQGATMKMAATGELFGGTNVWLSPSGIKMVQVEQLGSGFLFLCGDSNPFLGCGYEICSFAQRLWNYDDAEIL